MPKDISENQVPAVRKTFSILEYLLTADGATIKDISANCQIPPASTMRIVKTLTEMGYLEQNSEKTAASYRIGPSFLRFYQKARNSINLQAIAKPEMESLSHETSQTSQLAILEGSSVLYIMVSNNNVQLGIMAPLDSPIPINVSAGGKAICAYLPEEEKLSVLKRAALPSYTANTITDKMELLFRLSEIKKRGYEFDNEEYALGICCIAAPIFDHTGKVIAAVGITGPSSKYDSEEDFSKLVAAVQKTAASISRKIGNSKDSSMQGS